MHKNSRITSSSYVNCGSYNWLYAFYLLKNIGMMYKHDFTVIFLLVGYSFFKVLLLIWQITCSSPSHPADSFYYPKLKILPPIAQVTMVKLKKTQLGLSAPFINPPAKSNEVIDSVLGKWLVLQYAHFCYYHSFRKYMEIWQVIWMKQVIRQSVLLFA